MTEQPTRSLEGIGPAAASLQIGETVAGRELKLTLARVLAFSGGPFDELGWPHPNLHTSIDKAREAGLDNIIASGTQSEGLLIGLLLATFGAEWLRGGTLDVRFLKPVSVGTVIQPMLRCTGRDVALDRIRVNVECWCQTALGERVIEGTGHCAVPNVGRHIA